MGNIYDKFARYLVLMIPYFIITAIVFGIIRYFMWKSRNRRMFKTSPYHEVGVVFLACYLMCFIPLVIPRIYIENMQLKFIKTTPEKRLNLVPFKGIFETIRDFVIGENIPNFFTNFIGNMLLFVMVGFMVALLWRKTENLKSVALVGFVISFSIEFVQYFLHRASDIDDLILNVLGCCLGYFVYLVVKKISPRFAWLFKQAR